jgi:hypothetical protein
MFDATELSGVTSQLSFDVRLPDLPPDYYWLGGMNAFLECSNVGLWKRWLGYRALQILFDDEFNRLEFDLPQDAVSALGNASAECQFMLELATNPAYGPFAIDNGGFF